MNKNKFEIELALCIVTIYESVKTQKESWDKYLLQDDTYLQPYMRGRLTRVLNLLKPLYFKYDAWEVKHSDLLKFKRHIYDYIQYKTAVNNNKNKKKKTFDFEENKKVLPPGMVDSLVTFSVTYTYLFDKLELTAKRIGDFDKIKEVETPLKKFTDFMTNEIIDYTITKKGDKNKKEVKFTTNK